MTYPDVPQGLTSVGLFVDKGKTARQQRERLTAIGMDWFNRCQNERVKQERQWYYNYAFYSGNQHAVFRSVAGTNNYDLYVPQAPPWRVRIVVNQVRRIVRKEISRLTAQKPNAFVLPASNEDADVFAAQAGTQIWDSLWRRLEFNKTLRKAVFWQTVSGNGFIKSFWDATAKDPGSDMPGDISIQNINPFHIFVPDLMCEDIEAQPYMIHAQVKQNSWIKQNLGVDPSSSKMDSVDERLQSVMGVHRNETKKDQSIILEIWAKPGYLPELPQGGMFTLAGEQLVQGFDHWPYEHGMYPVAKLDGIPTGKFYNTSIVEDIIPLQQELNRSRAQLIESKNRMSKPQLVAEKGAVNAKRITTEPGQLIEYEPGFNPPQPLPLQNLPSYVTEEINRLYTDMSDLSGQHEVSNGSTPPGVTAATAISFLQEQDESLSASHYTSVEEANEKIAKMALSYVKTFWDEGRTVKVVGLDGSFDVQTFQGADLRGNVDIRIEAGSALPTSRAAKQAFLMDLMKLGFIQPSEGLELMEVGGLNTVYERTQIDNRQAQRENLKMRVITEQDMQAHMEEFQLNQPQALKDTDSGLALEPPPIVPVHTYDNHEIHIKVHNDYRKSQAFETADSVVKALFEEHVNQHIEAMANMMTHPLTGMQPSDPNAPAPEDEEAMMDQMAQEEPAPGPEAMPELQGEEMA
jgi:hypothetical protein